MGTEVKNLGNWEITILNKSKDGFLCAAPNGETCWMTKEDYENYRKNKDKKEIKKN